MKKVYVSARATTRLNDVKEIQSKLVGMGYKITYDWAHDDVRIARPYRHPKSRKINAKALPKMFKGAVDADVFIFIDEPGLRGAYIEYGAFLHEALKNPRGKRVFIVGKDSAEREHIFESPDFVHFVEDIDSVYKALK